MARVAVPGGVCAGLIEIIDARGVRFFGEERKNLSFRDRIAIRQVGHCGQGVNRSFVLRGAQPLPDFPYQALHLAHFSLPLRIARRARDIKRSRPGRADALSENG